MRHRSFLARVKRIRTVRSETAKAVTTLVDVRPLPGGGRPPCSPTWAGRREPLLGQLVRVAYVPSARSRTWRAAPVQPPMTEAQPQH